MAAWTVGYDVVSFFQQVLVPCPPKIPPFFFNVSVQVGPIGFLLVYENAQAPICVHPHLVIFHNDLFAFFYKAFFTDALQQLPLVLHAQKLLHLKFHGQALAVPSCPERHVEALHGFPSVTNVLHHAPSGVTNMRNPIQRWWSFNIA